MSLKLTSIFDIKILQARLIEYWDLEPALQLKKSKPFRVLEHIQYETPITKIHPTSYNSRSTHIENCSY